MTYFPKTQITLDPALASAFGTLETAELQAVFQSDFAYGLNTQLWNTAVVSGSGATVDTNSSRLRIQSGTNSGGYAYVTSKKIIRYRPGQGTTLRFTPVFSSGIVNNIQVWGALSISSNAPYDGYGFGYNGTSFGIVHYNGGVATWVAQSSWNVDKVDGSAGSSFTLDPTKGTPYQIKYPFLGYGDIIYQIQNPTTGQWVTVHIEAYANSSASTELTNPNLQFCGFTVNQGNTTNKTMYCGSVGIFISGNRSFISGPKWAADSNKSSVTTETGIISLKNCTTYNGLVNKGMVRLTNISVGNNSNSGAAIVRLKIGVTLGGSPSWSTVNGSTADSGATITSGNSIVSTDTAGTTITGGTMIFSVSVGNNGSVEIDLTPLELYVLPGEVLTISGSGTASSTIAVSINWTEDI